MDQLGSDLLRIGWTQAHRFDVDPHTKADLAQVAALALYLRPLESEAHAHRAARSAIIDHLRVQPGGTRTSRKRECSLSAKPLCEDWSLALIPWMELLDRCPFSSTAKLCWVQGYEQWEAAELEGISQSAVSRRLTLAREWLRPRCRRE